MLGGGVFSMTSKSIVNSVHIASGVFCVLTGMATCRREAPPPPPPPPRFAVLTSPARRRVPSVHEYRAPMSNTSFEMGPRRRKMLPFKLAIRLCRITP